MSRQTYYRQTGFTLIELMITIVIIGVIAAIALPSYQSSVRKSKRTEAKTELLQVMARQEQYFSETRKYTCLLYTSPSPRDKRQSRMPSSA